MINEAELKNIFESSFPDWNLSIRKSGVASWVNLNDGELYYFELQFTPSEGIGVSILKSPNDRMSGHDEVFENVEESIKFLKTCIN